MSPETAYLQLLFANHWKNQLRKMKSVDRISADSEAREKLYLALIIIIAAGARIFHLGHFGMWFDEAFSWHLTNLPISRIIEIEKLDNTPPFYHILLYFWLKTGASSDAAVRLPSAIFGIVSVFITYKLGRLLFNPGTALFAALIGALSFCQVQYSQENRMYSLQILLGLISTYYFIRGLRGGGIWHWIIWLVAGIMLFYNHLFAVFLFAGQWVYFIVDWKRSRLWWKRWLVLNLILAAACAFWAPVIIRQMGAIQDNYWVLPVSPLEIIKVGLRLLGGTDLDNRFVLTAILNSPFVLLSVIGLAVLIRGKYSEKLLLPIIFFLPFIIVYIISIGRQSLFFFRYFIFLTPYLHLMMALGLNKGLKGALRYIAGIAVIISSLIFLASYYTVSHYSEPQRMITRDVSFRLQEIAAPGEVVIHNMHGDLSFEPYFVSKRYNRDRFEEYVWRDKPVPFYFGRALYDTSRNISSIERFSKRDRIWVVTLIFENTELNADGLPLLSSDRLDKRGNSLMNPARLWEELYGNGYILKDKTQFDDVALCEFVREEDN